MRLVINSHTIFLGVPGDRYDGYVWGSFITLWNICPFLFKGPVSSVFIYVNTITPAIIYNNEVITHKEIL